MDGHHHRMLSQQRQQEEEQLRQRGEEQTASSGMDRVDVTTGFTFHPEDGHAPEIPDAFIDQHHRGDSHHDRSALHGPVLSAAGSHELLNHHGYNMGHGVVANGYEAHLYDVSGELLSEADLEHHVFHHPRHLIGEALVLPGHGKNGESMHEKPRKYYEEHQLDHKNEEVERLRNECLKNHMEISMGISGGKSAGPPIVGKERGGYTWWWKPGLIEPILDAVKTQKSYFKAVNYLKESEEHNSDGKYDKLSPSTVESWFVRGSFVTLKPQYLHHRRCLERSTRPGQKSILSKYPELLSAIQTVVGTEIRHASSHDAYHFDMKFVQQEMKRLIYQFEHQEILKENGGKLTLSPKFVRRFVKKHFADMPDPFPKRVNLKKEGRIVSQPSILLHQELEPLLTGTG